MTRVLVAMDGSDDAVRAGAKAKELFGADAEYLAMSVVASPAPTMVGVMGFGTVYPYPAMLTPGLVEEAEHEAAEIAEQGADAAGLEHAEVIADYGDPADLIEAAAKEHHCDVIVVAGSHRGWFSRLVVGSVSSDLVRNCDIPVLVVH